MMGMVLSASTGEHHGARGFDHPPSDCESDDGFCEDDGFY